MKKLLSLPVLGLVPILALASVQDPGEGSVGVDSAAQAERSSEQDLVVHEWGTFTSVAGSDGVALEWRPLLGKTSDLPGFVYGTGRGAPGSGLRFGQLCKNCEHAKCGCGDNCQPDSKGNCKACYKGTVRMETPVLYFYTKKKQRISVRVDFPGGMITEWYPRAKRVDQGIDWGTIELQPDYKGSFPKEKGKNHYYPARKTDAIPVQVCGPRRPTKEHEKFLFYRGVGTFPLPLEVALSEGRMRIENRSKQPIPAVMIFDHRHGRILISVHEGIRRGKKFISMPVNQVDETRVFKVLTRLLVKQGLFHKEAEAMVETWKDHWFTPGLRVFYLLPTAATDAILPLNIEPKPRKIVRVLVGRIEILTQEQRQEIRLLAAQLGDKSFAIREQASKGLVRIGRFAAPVLEGILLDCKDLEIRARIRALLER